MSLSNKLEELLSGYLDNQLTADELREVEASLNDPQVQAYLGSLRQNRDSLKILAQQRKPNIRPDFSKLVMAQIASQSAAQAANEEKATVSLPKAKSTIDSRIIAALVSIAAMLVLAIYFSQDHSGSRPEENKVVSDDSGSKIDSQQQDSVVPELPFKQNDPIPSGSRLVRRDDVLISYLMTMDIEIPKNQTSFDALGPLLEQYGIQLVKGAKLTDEVKRALDDLRVTPGPQGEPLATEVYLLKASLSSMDSILESIRSNPTSFFNVRLGMAYELPSDPLVDKLSADVQKEVDALNSLMKQSAAPILLGQAIANSVVDNQDVTVDQSFASPLVARDGDVRPSPFESIPEQGKLVSSSGRRLKNTIHQQTIEDDEKSFALLFVRQAK
ncbi:MAG: hypothetical protein U0930_00465 [Pirellulales bacterium]